MTVFVKMPFKLTREEVLASAAITICLNQLNVAQTPVFTIEDVCLPPQYGYTASAALEPVGPRFVRITDIKGGTIDWDTVPFCECAEPATYQISENDILIARSGSVGKSFFVTTVPENAVFASYMIRLRAQASYVASYVYWCLQSQQFWNQILGNSRGSAMANINGKMLSSLQFPFPSIELQRSIVSFMDSFRKQLRGQDIELPDLPSPLEDQRRIVAQIDALATQIEEARGFRRSALEEGENLWTSSMRQAFRTLKNYEIVSFETVCDAIIDNLHSNPIYASDGIPCIRSPDVGWGTLYLDKALKTDEEEYLHRTTRGEPTVNDIVFVREGGGTGKAALIQERQRLSLGQRVMLLRPNTNQVMPKFLLNQLLSPLIYDDQIVPRVKGSAAPHLNISALRNFSFVLPSLNEQNYVIAYLDALQAQLDALRSLQREAAAELDALLPSILDRAFRGEL